MEQTKKEMQEEIVNLKAIVEKLQVDLKQVLKERDGRIQEVLDIQGQLEKTKREWNAEVADLKRQMVDKEKQQEQISQKFNELAKLFDEYIKSFDDIMEVQKLFLRNNLRSQELMQGKIKAFNGEGEKDK
jgi:predicted RNase H-like nuclease (RuvC/YqgF family)